MAAAAVQLVPQLQWVALRLEAALVQEQQQGAAPQAQQVVGMQLTSEPARAAVERLPATVLRLEPAPRAVAAQVPVLVLVPKAEATLLRPASDPVQAAPLARGQGRVAQQAVVPAWDL